MNDRYKAGLVALFFGLFLLVAPAAAQESDGPLRERAGQVVALINGEGDPAALFTTQFLAQVPAARLGAIMSQLRQEHGRAQRVAGIEARSPTQAVVRIEAERAVLVLTLVIEPQPPHLISGLLITGVEVPGDDLEKVSRDIAALPGTTAFLVARIDGPEYQRLAEHRPDEAMAIGSAFKLFILGALQQGIAAGDIAWDEVVRIDRRSLPSGMLQNWPEGAPVTIHTLASLMISISDNTATDILLHRVGRENVERFMGAVGVEAAARNRPFLSTLEAFAIKLAPEEAYRAWLTADEAARRDLLTRVHSRVDPGDLDPAAFAGRPVRLPVEWFASAADLARTMDWLRREGGETLLDILAIAPGISPAALGGLDYVGFKGGSEAGVLNLTWLVRTGGGQWMVVTGSWNDMENAVDEARFTALMGRALGLVARRS